MENLDKIFIELEQKGSNKEELKIIGEKIKTDIKKEKDLDSIMIELIDEIKKETSNFLNKQNQYGINFITGLSSGIYLPSFDGSGEIKLLLYGGTSSRLEKTFEINSNTMFDIASITKVFTLILTYKLAELGIINLNDKISSLNPDFKGLEDFTFNDLIKLHGELYVNGNIKNAKTEKEAFEILKTIFLKNNSRNTNKYTDFGAIIIAKTLEKIMSEREKKKITLQELMEIYIYSKLNMNDTMFNPTSKNISGNGGYDSFVHDPKARLLGGMIGSAGIFTTSKDLMKLAKGLFEINYINKSKLESIISKENLRNMGEITYPDSEQSHKGNFGIFVKHPNGLKLTYTPPLFSNYSFSHQGWVGPVAVFDPNNLIHHNCLVNAIYKVENPEELKNDKPLGYRNAWAEYQINITQNIMIMMIVKKYFNMYKEKDININIEEKIL